MWNKLDDQFRHHPKVVQAGPLAGWLFICGLGYCAEYLTDGVIPGAAIHTLADFRGVGYETATVGDPPYASFGEDADGETLARVLVVAGLWEETDGGFRVHDYLKYNPSRRDVLRDRREWKARQTKHRVSRSVSRRDSPVTPGESQRDSERPVPVPVPVPEEHKKTLRQKELTAVELAQMSDNKARQESAHRLVVLAKERFVWRLTKSGLLAELRFAAELLDVWPEPTIVRALEAQRKLSSLRWLGERISAQEAPEIRPAPPPKERAWLDDPEPPDLPPEQVAANQARARELIATAMGKMP